MRLPQTACRFRDDLLERLTGLAGVHEDAVTATCPVCDGPGRLAVMFRRCEAAADLVCVNGCDETAIVAALLGKRSLT